MRNKIRRAVLHIRRWTVWRKMCINGPFYKFLVLIGLVKSPSFVLALLPEEQKTIEEAFTDLERSVVDSVESMAKERKKAMYYIVGELLNETENEGDDYEGGFRID